MALHLDKETRSDVNLKTEGLGVYLSSRHTDVLCAAYAFDEGPVKLWARTHKQFPLEVIEYVKQGGIVIAHNAQFEYQMWNKVLAAKMGPGFPLLELSQMYCTMAQCLAMALPASLDQASEALQLEHKKDMKGKRVMMQLSRPRDVKGDKITWWEESDAPKKFETLYSYCKKDVDVEREVDNSTLKLTPSEQKLWQIDQLINLRGVPVDLPAIKTAIEVVKLEKDELNKRMFDVTGGEVSSCTKVLELKSWLNAHGVKCEGVAKADVTDMLEDPNTPYPCKEALYLRRAAGKSSTAKLDSMLKRAVEGRVHFTLQYHAASTGRWGGRGIQTQNFKRPTVGQADIEYTFDLLKHKPDKSRELINMFYGDPVGMISNCLRGFIKAPEGRKFICGDWSAIEARVIAWLAEEERVLEIFRGHGKIYESEAAGIYRVGIEEVDDFQRQIGKVAVLSLGFQGGKGAFQSMAKNYGVKVSDERAEEIKVAWRESNPNIVRFWYALERASFLAVQNPGTQYSAGPITYVVKGSFLFCKLPSNRVLTYPYPKLEIVKTPWGADKEAVTFMTVDATTRKWVRAKSYGGFLAENVTQAVARDILSDCIVRTENTELVTFMHVHDELVCECPSFSKKEFLEHLMEEVPSWAKGLPLKAEAWEGYRYRK